MIEITTDLLMPDAITERGRADTNGAVVTFLGTTRLYTGGKRVLYLEYEAYRPMAERKLEEIVRDIRNRWNIWNAAIVHRMGRLEIGEISLVVAIASPHRKEAFLACHQAVDLLKETVPIWKKEVYEDGSRWVACEDHEFAPEGTAPVHSHAGRPN